ncbi:MAG TPA: endo alpha-1,4 polygalactosaminidase [Polyangiales bacterium]|nr:endo alpha-1,4 polygalactosaminidase [Polyangiales bacterium]
MPLAELTGEMPLWSALIVSLVLVACSATEGALLVRRERDAGSAGSADPGAAGSGSQPAAAVRSSMSLQYQITGQLDTQVDADLYVTDLFDTAARQVSDLHAASRLAMAYVSVGSLENWRPDASSVPTTALGMALAAYPNEKWMDPRRNEVRALIEARFDRAVTKGFDGVFASTLGAYRATSGFPLALADELEYAIFLSEAAHARGLSIGLSGDFELSQQLAQHYDWAIAIGCVERDYCDDLAPLVAAKKAVFDLETEGDQASVCRAAAAHGIPVTFKHRGFDAYGVACP